MLSIYYFLHGVYLVKNIIKFIIYTVCPLLNVPLNILAR